jgi:hypothetical protein
MGSLNTWEFEWYKALHLLRDGVELPPEPVYERMNRLEAAARLDWWKKAKPQDILGDMLRLDPPSFDELSTTVERARAKREWVEKQRRSRLEFAELERKSQIAELEQQMEPRKIHARSERRKTWETLVRARSLPALKQACEEWKRWIVLSTRFQKQLPDGRIQVAAFPGPDYVLANAKAFFQMKGPKTRFPKSPYADESRLEYLARGMAGVLMRISPQTAIERLRNMKHDPRGPMWNDTTKCCGCWRCNLWQWHERYLKYERKLLEMGETES